MIERPLRLFCFPPAGGSVAAFAGWSDHLPQPIVVLPIELPGTASAPTSRRWRRSGRWSIS